MRPVLWIFMLLMATSAISVIRDRYAGSWDHVGLGFGVFLLLWLLARIFGKLRHRLPPLPAFLQSTVARITWFGVQSLGTVLCFSAGGLLMVFSLNLLLSNDEFARQAAFLVAMLGVSIALMPLIRQEAEENRRREP